MEEEKKNIYGIPRMVRKRKREKKIKRERGEWELRKKNKKKKTKKEKKIHTYNYINFLLMPKEQAMSRHINVNNNIYNTQNESFF